uniref:Secreted protein n=1 Tax=Ditylenchus dipsaci TaxID=166011 RepID=A0A915D163_9BILA
MFYKPSLTGKWIVIFLVFVISSLQSIDAKRHYHYEVPQTEDNNVPVQEKQDNSDAGDGDFRVANVENGKAGNVGTAGTLNAEINHEFVAKVSEEGLKKKKKKRIVKNRK